TSAKPRGQQSLIFNFCWWFITSTYITMPPKRPAAPSGSTPKRARRVLTLNEKNEVLKQLDSGMSYAAVGRHFGLNESSCINFIAESHNELSQNCVRSCWKKLWPEIVPTFTGFPTAEPQLRNIITMANEVGGEGFSDLTAAEVQEELLGNVGDPFTSDELEQLVELQDETDDEVSDDENKNLTLDNLGEVIRMSKALSARLYDIDPSLDRSLKAKRAIENVMLPYIELQREMRSKKAQTTITNFFSRRVPAIAEPAGILQQEAEAADTSQQQDVEAAGTSQQQDAVPAHTPQEDADLDSSYSSD
ncbi:putative Tigger transposable element-derived protein 1-like 287, partial [Homarus americanus]